MLEQFADDSGGRAFFPYHVDDLAISFARYRRRVAQPIFAGLCARRPLTDGKFHTIRIAVDHKGLAGPCAQRLLRSGNPRA